ncbi:prepilin-type N-terminal cleavage/methylation domain-containing protein [Bradyrhizobium sp. WSM 1704]|uniref:prepilin-type N-terminal cleavage/methylation domain-containing protein n=1 Tax=Bradyrhizobium semiaridum TaxID=2821404 RepID=UPI001CE298E2|nr:prepilin-type N-terminal cleavage/methylation domain-containing protein [Bradyrhizobium semiaridum]MCA6120306.1 prepilin-type N-terminal cleavage/methylation domain-containing protein [Bradyrhizobium semiaridum]
MCPEARAARAGFTLIEALVALALLLAFVSVLGPHLFYARRIADRLDGRIAAQTLLRTILDAPLDRAVLANGTRDGETGGLRWSVTAEPMFIDAMVAKREVAAPIAADKKERPGDKPVNWIAFHLVASVSWGPGQVVRADTLRLGLGAEE